MKIKALIALGIVLLSSCATSINGVDISRKNVGVGLAAAAVAGIIIYDAQNDGSDENSDKTCIATTFMNDCIGPKLEMEK